jgi:hypothetical protein
MFAVFGKKVAPLVAHTSLGPTPFIVDITEENIMMKDF